MFEIFQKAWPMFYCLAIIIFAVSIIGDFVRWIVSRRDHQRMMKIFAEAEAKDREENAQSQEELRKMRLAAESILRGREKKGEEEDDHLPSKPKYLS